MNHLNEILSDSRLIYNGEFYCNLNSDLRENRKVLIKCFPYIWQWEETHQLVIEKAINENYKHDETFITDAINGS